MTCLLDRSATAEEKFRAVVSNGHYDIIVIGGGVRLEPSLTYLFEKLINIARTHSPGSTLCCRGPLRAGRPRPTAASRTGRR